MDDPLVNRTFPSSELIHSEAFHWHLKWQGTLSEYVWCWSSESNAK